MTRTRAATREAADDGRTLQRGFTLLEILRRRRDPRGHGRHGLPRGQRGASRHRECRRPPRPAASRPARHATDRERFPHAHAPPGAREHWRRLSRDAPARSQFPALVELSHAGWPNGAGTPRGTVQRVVYLLEDGKLERQYWTVMDATLSTVPVKRELLDHVQRVEIRYLTSGREWITEWPQFNNTSLPSFTVRPARRGNHRRARGLGRDQAPGRGARMKQRGVALIMAIVLVALATVLAVHIGTRAALDLRRTAGLVALDQGWHVALGAEAWAAEVLHDDREDNDTGSSRRGLGAAAAAAAGRRRRGARRHRGHAGTLQPQQSRGPRRRAGRDFDHAIQSACYCWSARNRAGRDHGGLDR